MITISTVNFEGVNLYLFFVISSRERIGSKILAEYKTKCSGNILVWFR